MSRKGSVVSNIGDSAVESSGRLLSLDGGGVKGLVLTRMLLSMEKVSVLFICIWHSPQHLISMIELKVWGVPTPQCFDWICGTSTGGMLALGLVSGRSVMECQFLYMRLKDKVMNVMLLTWRYTFIRVINYYCNLLLLQVFVGSKPYSTKPMEELLKSEFGDLKMYQLKDTK